MMVDHVVAIVEDNLAIRQSMELLLKLEGYEVSAHASPASFLADRTMRPACLITDQNMSGMTGLQLISQLRQQENQIPVLLMCGYLSTDIIERASELGVSRVLEKPLELDDLLEFVGGLS
jgi:two-component system, LuxR family, response regulator FixJ